MFFVDNNQKANFDLSYAFPLVVHETYLADKPMGFNNWHWHEEMQFSYVLEGSMITTAQGNDYVLHPGDGFFINSNLSHMTRPLSKDSARYLSLNVKPSLLTLFHGSIIERKYFLPFVDHPYFQFVPLSPTTLWQEQTLSNMLCLFRILQEQEYG
ncbi:MAG: cupin domain-containing protein, partial [Oscillospiraceae bacterium]|nr:cupin domain-containing protein [Oscillospiraceae bacterium]